MEENKVRVKDFCFYEGNGMAIYVTMPEDWFSEKYGYKEMNVSKYKILNF